MYVMKKIIKVLFITLMVSMCFISIIFADTTKRRGITEFCELVINRADRLEELGLDFGIEPSNLFLMMPSFDEKTNSVSTAIGYVDVYPDDFTISGADLAIYNPDFSDEENDQYCAKCALAISALEYDYSYDEMYFITGNRLNSINPLFVGFDIIHDNAQRENGDSLLDEAAETGQKVLLYSGNYDYYIRLIDTERAYYFSLCIEEK